MMSVTNLVAVEGRYESFPWTYREARLYSEVESLTKTCCEWPGLPLILDTPKNAPWVGDEVAKRQRLLDLAHVLAGGEEAWICVWDADYRMWQPWSQGRDEEIDAFAKERSLDILISDDPCEGDPPEDSWYRMKMFMRLEPGLRMGPNHHTYVYPDGEELQILPRNEDAPLIPIKVRHLKYRRSQARIDAQAAYYAVRDGQGLEV